MPRFQLTAEALQRIGGPKALPSICQGTVAELAWLDKFGISRPHRLAHFLSQCGEESDHFHTLTEYASGSAYEGRADLGNTESGDGPRFKGRALIEDTGRANYRAFTKWMRSIQGNAPDFEATPTLLASFPWAVYAAVWYWVSHDLNRYADDNNIIVLTERINGGLNGFGERLAMYARAGLFMLGYDPSAVKQFQKDCGLAQDGIVGDKTRGAIHARLEQMEAAPSMDIPIIEPPITPVNPDVPAVIRPPRQPEPRVAAPVAQTHAAAGVAGVGIGAAIAGAAGVHWGLIIGGALLVAAAVAGTVYVLRARGQK